jgi:tetratricopeptide (TPR) repeat protein
VKLLIYRGDTLERTLDLTDRDVRIGRGAENDVVLEDPEKTVSRFHAELRPEQGGWVVLDLNSQNGIWIEGQRIQRQVLRAGQIAQLGNFRIVIDGGAGASAVPAAASPAEMPATMVMSREPAAPAAGPGQAGEGPAAPSSMGPTSPGPSGGGAPSPPPPSPIQPAVAPRRPKLTPTDGGDQKKGIASIPRPIFYGGSLFLLLLIIGVMYIMKPRPTSSASDEPQPPQPPQQQQQEPGASQPQAGPNAPPGSDKGGGQGAASQQAAASQQGNETNEQIVARYVKEGKDKLDAGDPAAAIESFNRALMIDPSNAEALDLKMRADEKRHQQQQAGPATPGLGTPGPGTSTTGAGKAGTGGGSLASGAQTAGGQAAGGQNGGGSGAGTATPTSTAAADAAKAEAAAKAKAERAAAVKGRKEKAAREAATALQKRYAQAKAAVSRGDYEHAIPDLEAILRDKPGYQDTASLLDEAKRLRRADAQKSVTSAAAAAGKGEYVSAMRDYERAARIDPGVPGLQEAIAGVRKQMHDAGEQAYRRARQLDAVGRRLDALELYQRAVALLPADDPDGKAARDRLEALKGQKP